MPKQRFFQLPEEKRQRIVDAALAELSRVPYEDASINQIIRTAGIPRGSFYQYFEDKDDLLRYLLSGFFVNKKQLLAQLFKDSGGDIFTFFGAVLREIVSLGLCDEYRPFCQNVFSRFNINEKEDRIKLNIDIEQLLSSCGMTLDTRAFKTRERAQIADLLSVLLVLMRRAVVRVFSNQEPPGTVLADFDRELEWLQYGFLKQEAGA